MKSSRSTSYGSTRLVMQFVPNIPTLKYGDWNMKIRVSTCQLILALNRDVSFKHEFSWLNLMILKFRRWAPMCILITKHWQDLCQKYHNNSNSRCVGLLFLLVGLPQCFCWLMWNFFPQRRRVLYSFLSIHPSICPISDRIYLCE